jgi:hypothetical protein
MSCMYDNFIMSLFMKIYYNKCTDILSTAIQKKIFQIKKMIPNVQQYIYITFGILKIYSFYIEILVVIGFNRHPLTYMYRC